MTLIMTKDGNVRPMQMMDLKEVADRDVRIAQLEALNATLAAQVDQMRPVVDAACNWEYRPRELEQAVIVYRTAMAVLTKEPRRP